MEREDVAAAGVPAPSPGFAFAIPPRYLDGQPHHLFLKSRFDEVVLRINNEVVDSIVFSETIPPVVMSFIDGGRGGAIQGWVLTGDEINGLKGGRDILVKSAGEVVGQVKANRYRGDVGKALSADPYCGFQFRPNPAQRRPYPQDFHFYLLPEMTELNNSPYHTSFVTDDQEASILEIVDQIDTLHKQLTSLRRQVKDIIPRPGDTLDDYHSWAVRYFPILRAYVDKTRVSHDEPLISVICPVWRPERSDFTSAVESVLSQTWSNWELILVDDCSEDETLRQDMIGFTKRDPRIKAIFKSTNNGISATTNVGIEAAAGEWIAFFDHDDVLVDVALELMMREAVRSQAELVYSDEDKIDRSGYYSNPSFKTDWNYRLLLGVNYVCHFVLAKTVLVRSLSGLRSQYDGAQDHDFLLRISEAVSYRSIHHVPEILYHWRITGKSTAGDIGNKSYAISAGVKAVSDHLRRRDLRAEVASRRENTLYDIKWITQREPEVTIIIPFKDEIATTRRCVEAILSLTTYSRYKIRLVNNWSVTAEAAAFIRQIDGIENADVLTLEEEFNYSRINNKAARLATGEFLVFLNNDVFVEQADWLNILVNEALVDPEIAIVGGKFVYPNQTIQHAGVLLGIGGVAGHAHVGIPRQEGGYAGRALFAQEMSAVTAAGLLIRKSVFEMVAGFDEENLAVAFNDIDLCLRVRERGYRIIWTPDFCAEHHESLSRGSDDRPTTERRFFHETEYMLERWSSVLRRDPFYNPHFALDRQPFYDLVQPGVDPDRYAPLARERPVPAPLVSEGEGMGPVSGKSVTLTRAPKKAQATSDRGARQRRTRTGA